MKRKNGKMLQRLVMASVLAGTVWLPAQGAMAESITEFTAGINRGDTITVNSDSTVNGIVNVTNVNWSNDNTISRYIVDVADGTNLIFNDVVMYNPTITGNGNITINANNVTGYATGGVLGAEGAINSEREPVLDSLDTSLNITAKNLSINNNVVIPPKGTVSDSVRNFYINGASGIFIRGTKNSKNVSEMNFNVQEHFSVYGSYCGIHVEAENTYADININAATVDINGKSSYGVFVNGSTSVSINASNNIAISSRSSGGVSNNGTADVNITSTNGEVFVNGGNYYGLISEANSGDINVTSNANTVSVSADTTGNAYVLRSRHGDVVVKATTGNNNIIGLADKTRGAYSYTNANTGVEVNALKGSNIVEVGLDGAHSLAGEIAFKAAQDNIVSAGQDALKAEGENSTITVTAGNLNSIKAENNAMNANKGGTITVASTNALTKMVGNVLADTAGTATSAFDSTESYLLGTVTTDDGATTTSETNLDFTNGATWYLTGDSNVTNMDLSNGIVDMTQNEKGNAHKVSIDNALTGSNGVFKMDLTYHDNDVKTYEDAADSDFIYIHGGNGGQHTIAFADNDENLGAMNVNDKLYFAKVYDDSASFGDGETIESVNTSGIYNKIFEVESENSAVNGYKDWYITYHGDNTINPNGITPVTSYNAAFALWRDDDTLLKRLGELRYSDDEGGVWARVITKKLERDDSRYGFTTHAKTAQVGYDRKTVSEDGSGTWRRGIALAHTWADTSFDTGKGENNFTDITLYGTNIRSKDHYLDLVARFGRVDSEYDTVYGDSAEFDNWAGSLSAEYGRKKKLNDDNWFIEPQAQLTYSYMWGDDFTTNNGTRVSQEDADSLVGRLGFILSKEFESERKLPNRYYVKASVLHEFLGDNESGMSYNGTYFYDGADYSGTWYVVGLGFNAAISDTCDMYFDAEKAFKADVDMPYRIEAGLRWEF